MKKNKKQSSCEWTKPEKDLVMSLQGKMMYQMISDTLWKKGFFRSAEAIRKFIKREEKRLNNQVSNDTQRAFNHPAANDATIFHDVGINFLNTMGVIENQRQQTSFLMKKNYGKIGNPEGPLEKIVAIGDLHIPWVNDNVIADMLSNHSDAKTLVINGDFLDQYSVSKWSKTKQVLLRHEYEMGVSYLEQFAKIFDKVILTRGNHDSRLQSYFSNSLDPNVLFMTNPDMLQRMADGYAFDYEGVLFKKHDFDNVFYKGGVTGWFTKIGKCLFVHPSGGSSIPMRLAVNSATYFLEKDDFDCLVSAHSHKMGKLIWKGKLLMESGCCCVPMDYEADAKMKYSQQAFGYCVVYMNEKGEVDFNKSVPVYYGTASAIGE